MSPLTLLTQATQYLIRFELTTDIQIAAVAIVEVSVLLFELIEKVLRRSGIDHTI